MSYDIYLSPQNNGPALFSFYYKQAVRVTGMTKLVQLFLKFLLTPAGSDIGSRNIGTGLPELFSSNVADNDYARAAVELAVQDAVRQVQSRGKSPTDTLELRSGEVTGMTIDRWGGANVAIRLTASDGTETNIGLPIAGSSTATSRSATINRLGALLEGL